MRNLRKNLLTLVVGIGLLLSYKSVSADVVVSYGTFEGGVRYINLDPNRANQAIEFFVSGGDAVDGLELDLQIRDGGSTVGGVDTGPRFGTIDLITGTIFAGANPTQQNVVQGLLAIQSTVDTTSTVLANGRIATVNFDTTGFGPGLYAFSMTVRPQGGGSFPTTFFNGVNVVPTTAPDGFIRVVPEPSSCLLIAGLAGLAGMRRRRE
jgi:hypothetical protein